MAIAPQRAGIGVRRHFTTEGIHPYDEVQWELRDARITNFRDGTVAFEQRGVEVPASWSVNATNILAQKYFRGTLGTPEREWSLKQVADRVVDTITAWGMKDGYFVDGGEAEIFRDELKYLIIHQKAAFNSPVWFNIGVKDVPQQASACQPYDSLVCTPRGMVPIGALVDAGAVGTKVLDAHGLTAVVAVKQNGRKEVLRIRTESGHVLDVTADHLVWRARDDRHGEFVPAGDLVPHDGLAWCRTESFGEDEITQGAIAEAALAGWLQSDQGADLDRCRTRLSGSEVADVMEHWGVGVRGPEATVPSRLMTAPQPVVVAYLQSLFQAEGSVSLHERATSIVLGTICEGIARGVQALLSRLGIFSRIAFEADARPDRPGRWSLAISELGDRQRFADEVGFIDPSDAARLVESLSSPGRDRGSTRRLEIESIEPRGVMDVYDIQTESGEYLSESLRVHNCFILSVDDSMDSILNWYTEEGIIFKGGSGAGVNLSRIRSSHELLKGGGTASGPVSFMRGADASAGTIKSGGKCFREGTLVSTPEGWRPIEQLRIGDPVLTHEGPRPVADFMANGAKPCFRVCTKEGYEVEVTVGHKFAFWNEADGCFDVKPIEAFAPGDALYVLVAPSEGGSTISLLPPQVADPPHATAAAEMQFPTELDERLAYVLGIVYGGGALGTAHPDGLRAVFSRDEAGTSAEHRFADDCEALFGERPVELGDEGGRHHIGLAGRRLGDFLGVNGIAKGEPGTLGFPSLLLQATAGVRAAFLAGVVDADGSAQGRDGWSVASTDRSFLRQLQLLALSLGVPSRLTAGTGPQSSQTHRIDVVEKTLVERLVDQLLPYSARCQVGSVPFRGARTGWGDATTGATTTGVAVLARRGGDVALCTRAVTTTVRVTIEAVVPTGVAPTYDIEVEGAHLLSANGIYASNTRRAAKMVILDADHPDIEDFIWCKAIEERKARVLRDAGFDMDLDGADSHSTQYQNANNSVRVTDEFMQAVLDDRDWTLVARTDASVVRTVKARDLFRQIAHAAWECADPGMQFDTTINTWHTAPNAGRINGSNPCFPGTARVHTDKGLIQFSELVDRVNRGEAVQVYTHETTSPSMPTDALVLTSPDAFMITGDNDIVRLRFDNGMELRCTPGHKIFTVNRGYVEASQLDARDEVKVLDLPAPAVNADPSIPVSSDPAEYASRGDHVAPVRLPDEWTRELAHYMGWLLGAGSVSGSVLTTVYRSAEDRDEILPGHHELVEWMNGDRPTKIAEQPDGTCQLRSSGRVVQRYFAALGLGAVRGPHRVVPPSIEQAPAFAVAAFLRGVFDAEGYVAEGRRASSSVGLVGLASTSPRLLLGVQRLLTTFGIASDVQKVEAPARFELQIAPASLLRFAGAIGFSVARKRALLADVAGDHEGCDAPQATHLLERTDDGVELTYNLCEPRNHSYIVDGIVVRNCSEYMHIDNSACNLASLNLLTYLRDDGSFDVDGFKAGVAVVFTGQEILVGNADYPTEAIAESSRRFRELGIGYANLGALLMANGLPYDSDGGRAWAAAITALMTGHAYATSARTAARMGPFAGFHENAEAMVNVLRMHQAEASKVDEELVPPDLLSAAQESWDEAVDLAEQFGVRNSQASVLAPTGTIGLLMDCDTTGVEPDLGLVKTKKLVGGGTMSIVNQTVPRALRQLGYGPDQVDEIVAYIDEHKTIVGAPHLVAGHLPVFACSMGDNTIHYSGHVRMMGAVQPFISGAISKTVNMPEDVTVEEVEQLHIDAWHLGIKAVAIYRDNCKVAQPLSTTKKEGALAPGGGDDAPPGSDAEARDRTVAARIAELEEALAQRERQAAPIVVGAVRERLPRKRRSSTFAFRVADCEGYVTVGEYEDGRPGEVFVKVSKQGSTLAGIMDAFSISISLGLQHGVPLATYVRKYSNMKFEPAGITDDSELRIATSLVDYIFRRLALDYLAYEDRLELGVLSTTERTQPTLPGVEESATPTVGITDAGVAAAESPAPTAGPVRGMAGGPAAVRPHAASQDAAYTLARAQQRDAPFCYSCGNVMQRAGSCYVCPSCGSTSGCS